MQVIVDGVEREIVPGTVVESTLYPDNNARYVYDPVEGKPPWKALEANLLMALIYSDVDGDIRFPESDFTIRLAVKDLVII